MGSTRNGIISGLLLVLALLTGGADIDASEEVAATEGLECTACHADGEPEQLTDRGLYYGLLATLDGFEEVLGKFGSCTYCHVGEAGSTELTREGYRFRWMMEDMAGLRAWLAENHPQPPDEELDAEPEGD